MAASAASPSTDKAVAPIEKQLWHLVEQVESAFSVAQADVAKIDANAVW